MDNGLMKSPNQHILVIGMGGTIAGLAEDPNNPSAYLAGQVPLEGLIPTVQPGTGFAHSEIRTEQLANIDSRDLSEALLTQLGLAVRAALDSPDVLGIVVTHGTDTIEETGLFLGAVCSKQAERLGKRVILTGAMLPSNHPQADGSLNLQAALNWAQMDLETCPAGIFAIQTRFPDQNILNGIVEHVPHVQHSRHIGRRNDDAEGLAFIRYRAKIAPAFPVSIPAFFNFGGGVASGKFHGWVDVFIGGSGDLAASGMISRLNREYYG